MSEKSQTAYEEPGKDPSEKEGIDSIPNSDSGSFLTITDRSSHRFECRSCGYVYDPKDGDRKLGIPKGTSFDELDAQTFRCPVCRAKIEIFRDIGPRDKPSGFEENLNYGFGVNGLTPGQKNVLIFGGLALAVACFLSLYSLH